MLLDHLFLIEGVSEGDLLSVFRRSDVPYYPGGAKLRDIPLEESRSILQMVNTVIDPSLIKYAKYVCIQIANGNFGCGPDGAYDAQFVFEDAPRLNETIRRFEKLRVKKVWTKSTNLYDFANWRGLERLVMDRQFDAITIDEKDDTSPDAVVLYSKDYRNNALNLIFGDEPEVTTYYFRSILTPEGAAKYGKGTQWCTNTTVPPRYLSGGDAAKAINEIKNGYYYGVKITDEITKSIEDFKQGVTTEIINPAYWYGTAMGYIRHAGLYMVEVRSPQTRRPVLQISGDQIMNRNDLSIGRVGVRLGDFLGEVLKNCSDRIHPDTAKAIQHLVQVTKLMK